MIERTYKVIKDNVHGYIKIPTEYFNKIIDTELFQRLRDIEQTDMRILYPSAHHDRFIHSLGVFHLGCKAFESFKQNISNVYNGKYFKLNDKNNDLFWDKLQIIFELACLLHDCGHAPFSHTFEFLYDADISTKGKSYKNLNKTLADFLNNNGSNNIPEDLDGKGAPHERMSALMVCTEYKSAIDEVLDKYHLSKDINLHVTPIELVTRMIIGYKYDDNAADLTLIQQISNCLIDLLNSSMIDVDSLDYIVRDAYMSGVQNINIDLERIISSFTIVELSVCDNVRLKNEPLDADIPGVEITPLEENEKASLGSDSELYGDIACTEFEMTNFSGAIERNGKNVICDNAEFRNDGTNIKYNSFDRKRFNGAELQGNINGRGGIKADKIVLSGAYFNGIINGCLKGKVLCNLCGKASERTGVKVIGILGYKKNCLSVIQNVISARNYEYQWIYTHHKVVYYSNFICVELLRLVTKHCLEEAKDNENPFDEMAKIISVSGMISGTETNTSPNNCFNMELFRISDSDLRSIYRKASMVSKNEDKELYELYNEYKTRHYRCSTWKSYAEMRNFLHDFSDRMISDLKDRIISDSRFTHKKDYGYFNNDWSEKLETFGMLSPVWVGADVKIKHMDLNTTYIQFNDRAHIFSNVSTQGKVEDITDKSTLFYIYYLPCIDSKIDWKGFHDYLKAQVSE